MKYQLFIAAQDENYITRLSKVLWSKHADSFEVNACSDLAQLPDMTRQNYDISLMDAAFIQEAGTHFARLTVLFRDRDISGNSPAVSEEVKSIDKYQRISAMVRQILTWYAEISGRQSNPGNRRARIIAVWSPAGGSGKTTVALACAASLSGRERNTVYLDLETFSSTPVYFDAQGEKRGLGTVLEKLQDHDAVASIKSAQLKDSASGIFYFNPSTNYADISALERDEISTFLSAVAADADDVIVDMDSAFNAVSSSVMEMADLILLVADNTRSSRCKCELFRTQNNEFYSKIANKLILIANRGASITPAENEKVIALPTVPGEEPYMTYRNLSRYFGQL